MLQSMESIQIYIYSNIHQFKYIHTQRVRHDWVTEQINREMTDDILKESPIFTAALFTTAKTWKQASRPLTEEWIKTWCTYTMDYY